MTSRFQCEDTIAEFISDLRAFATGSYLQKDELEWWEPPFEVSAVAKIDALLQDFAQSLIPMAQRSSDRSEDQTSSLAHLDFVARVGVLFSAIDAINHSYGYAVIEAEEYADLQRIIEKAAEEIGLSSEEIADLPAYEEAIALEDEN
ncbi:hypothetical protein [Corynebacterium silvaticum]|uniref:Uncharacterized protein n=1 Tax=Corynebacterium silvaticum TaxID=2320431 RepID=A0A7Y4P9F1_9CORY|nr:hypothetical protein [Corynebacterium silvaticum]ARU46162.1 hypothetical protein CBE74_06315 [Corynebacterium silvaticum]MBH5299273.1 hypothetical protein [Corynebacterium silvaticum]NOM64407.1 hypothetical protein [Corynebacterium silvaticum]NON69616.1 hypothetical protein [Corynebacterium silvaticum]TFA94233.1 hypothetical protein EU802_02610 [Corynebacterium silvaticum]